MKKSQEVNLSEEIQDIENIDYLAEIILAKIDLSILKYQLETKEDSLSATPHIPESKIKL